MTISKIIEEIEAEQMRLKENLSPGWPAALDRVCDLMKELSERVANIEVMLEL